MTLMRTMSRRRYYALMSDDRIFFVALFARHAAAIFSPQAYLLIVWLKERRGLLRSRHNATPPSMYAI